MRPAFLRTLTGKTLLRLALAGAVVLLLSSLLGAWLLFRQLEGTEMQRLVAQASEKARVAERVLQHTAETHEAVRRAFVQKWPAYQDAATLARFDALLQRYPDGAWRNRPEISDGRQFPTGWIHRDSVLSDDLRRRIVLFYDLSQTFGPGAAVRRDNLFFTSLPEEANMGYDPVLYPNWIFDIDERFTHLDYEWGRIAYEPVAPGAPTRWAAPLVDGEVATHVGPVFTALTPIHIGQRHLGTVGTTLPLSEFLGRVLPETTAAGRTIVFHPRGLLIADTALGDRLGPSIGKATLARLGGDLPAMLQAVQVHADRAAHAAYARESDSYFALARIDGPGWYLATVLPGAALRRHAWAPALSALGAGFAVLMLLLLAIAVVLRRQVAAPLGELTRAAETLAAGGAPLQLPARRDDELGRLAGAFNHMSEKVAERDAALRQDKEHIETTLESLRQSEATLARQRESLRQSEKLSAMGALLAGVAHELNNPLAILMGRSALLEAKAGDPAVKADARKIHAAAERCGRIVRTFLSMARQQPAQRHSAQLADVVAGAVDLVGYSLRSSGIVVEQDLAPGLPALQIDADQVGQVLVNLLVNAQQALTGQPEPRRVRIDASLRDGRVGLRVADNGPGVPDAVRERIFDPFFTTKPEGAGTGVGLSVSRAIAREHGGELRLLESGSGAVFELELPLGSAAPAAVRAGSESAARMLPAGHALIVDDEPELRQLLCDVLHSAGCSAVAVSSGREALAWLDHNECSFILCDMRMPDMDGPALWRALQQRHPQMLPHLAFVTGDTLSASVTPFLRETGAAHLDKPFSPEEVLELVVRIERPNA